MKIEVAINDQEPQKKKGDLLESIATELLKAHNYEVENQIRNTGVELDLLCQHKANISKKIYVECKAYAEDKRIQSDVITHLHGIWGIKKYEEAWLISTSELGKDAKGLVQEIEAGEDRHHFIFYTPERLLTALEDSKIIKSNKIAEQTVLHLVKDQNKIGQSILLITEFGYYWAIEYKSGGRPVGMIFTYADNCEAVTDITLLENLANTNASFKNLDFLIALDLCGLSIDVIRAINAKEFKLSNHYLNQINDLEIKFIHPNKDTLVLEDIFTFPDLEYVEDEDRIRISSTTLLEFDEEFKRCMIFGDG